MRYNKKDNQFYFKIRKEINTVPDKYVRGKVYFSKSQTKKIKELLRSKESPLTYRIKVKNGRYYLQIIFQYKHNTTMCDTRNSNGVIGVDFNKGFVAVSETDSYGNLINTFNIKYRFRSGTKTESDFQWIAKILSEYCLEEGKDLVSVITNLKVGDAVVSTLQEDGSPSFAEVVSIYPPKSKLDAVDAFVRQQLVNQSPFYDKYAEMFDRESAHEQLLALEQQFQQEQEEALAQREAEKQAEAERKEAEKQEALAQKEAEKQAKLEEKERERQERELERQARQAATKKGDSAMDRFTKNIMSSVGREVGRVITRGVMGLFKK